MVSISLPFISRPLPGYVLIREIGSLGRHICQTHYGQETEHLPPAPGTCLLRRCRYVYSCRPHLMVQDSSEWIIRAASF